MLFDNKKVMSINICYIRRCIGLDVHCFVLVALVLWMFFCSKGFCKTSAFLDLQCPQA